MSIDDAGKAEERRQLGAEYRWAIEIIAQHFSEGLERTFDRKRLRSQIDRFAYHGDPVYSRLLRSSGQDVYETFVGFWKLGQTVATQSRFWLEWAICDIVRHQRKEFGTRAYSLRDLAAGGLATDVAFMGEETKQWDTSGKAFRVSLGQPLLDYVEREVGRRERAPRPSRLTSPQETATAAALLARADRVLHEQIVSLIAERPGDRVPLQCNLLVIEPPAGGVWAIRYINDKVLGPAQARREKANVLRLFGWLCQEKILRRPDKMTAVAAEMVPRWNTYPADRGPEMFSYETWWSHERLWDFIGVPYAVVEIAIDEIGRDLRQKLVGELATILPKRPN